MRLQSNYCRHFSLQKKLQVSSRLDTKLDNHCSLLWPKKAYYVSEKVNFDFYELENFRFSGDITSKNVNSNRQGWIILVSAIGPAFESSSVVAGEAREHFLS